MRTPAFQFYPGDWLSSTNVSLMSPAEEGAYIRLLCYMWNDPNCSLPDDDQVLAVLSRLGDEGWLKGGSTIKACFIKKGNFFFNKKLLNERKKQTLWRKKSQQGGINSGKVRKNKDLGLKVGDEGWLKGGCDLVGTKDEPKGNTSSSSSSSSFKDKDLKKKKDTDLKKKKSPPKKKYGELKKVLLTDVEVSKLKERFGEEGCAAWILTLDEGVALHGYKYDSHYLAILNWARKEEKEKGRYL